MPRLTRRQAITTLGALSLPLDRLLAQTPALPVATPTRSPTAPAQALAGLPPDLANFQPMMEWLARENAPKLSFLDPQWKSLDAWKAAARPVLRDRLGYAPAPLPLTGEVIRREERDGFTLEVVHISATPAYHIPARVLIPKNASGKNCPRSSRCIATAANTPGVTRKSSPRPANSRC